MFTVTNKLHTIVATLAIAAGTTPAAAIADPAPPPPKVTHADFSFTKFTDQASAKFF